jgi:hypothetical protein
VLRSGFADEIVRDVLDQRALMQRHGFDAEVLETVVARQLRAPVQAYRTRCLALRGVHHTRGSIEHDLVGRREFDQPDVAVGERVLTLGRRRSREVWRRSLELGCGRGL